MDYHIEVLTADESGAGTDSNIFLTLVGDRESSSEHRLNGLIGGDAFERGRLIA